MNQLRERRKVYLGKVGGVREYSGETTAFWCVKSGRGDERGRPSFNIHQSILALTTLFWRASLLSLPAKVKRVFISNLVSKLQLYPL